MLVLPERLVGVLVALARLQVALPVNETTDKNSQWEENFGSCMNYLGIATCGAKNRHAPFPFQGKASKTFIMGTLLKQRTNYVLLRE